MIFLDERTIKIRNIFWIPPIKRIANANLKKDWKIAEKIENNSVQNDLIEIKNELANLSSNTTTSSTIDPAIMERIQAAPSSGASDNAAGLSELKYYIVELMKDQNEIRQIVKELREILEKNEEN